MWEPQSSNQLEGSFVWFARGRVFGGSFGMASRGSSSEDWARFAESTSLGMSRFFAVHLFSLFILWFLMTSTTLWLFTGIRMSGNWHESSVVRRVIGGIDGHHFENEGLMKRELKRLAEEQQSEAEKQGLSVDPQLLHLETSNDFVKYAAKRGAEVKRKGNSYLRVQKGPVWWEFRATQQKFKKKEVKVIIITAFKAMGIGFK